MSFSTSCRGDEEPVLGASVTPGAAASGAPAPASVRVPIDRFKYRPRVVQVGAGGRVTWTNFDRAPHTSTSDRDSVKEFDTGTLRTGESRTIRFDNVGQYPYYCELHPFMTGTVEVVD